MEAAAAEFRQALALLEPLTANNSLRESVPRLLRQCEEMLALDKKLPAVLRGDAQPADAAEQVKFAELCYLKKQHAVAARFYAGAFAAQPTLAGDLQVGTRYNAACSAALASAGRREGADKQNEKEPRIGGGKRSTGCGPTW